MVPRNTSGAATDRRQERGGLTREKVILAAAECVAEEGFAAAHTNRIAERAGVTWGVLQHHFGDQAGLLDAVLERGMEEMRRLLKGLEYIDRVVAFDETRNIFVSLISLNMLCLPREDNLALQGFRRVESLDDFWRLTEKTPAAEA